MSQELEQTRFRNGESAKRPYWGNVADAPFAQTLRCVAIDRGYKSQTSLNEALGGKGNASVSMWSSDRRIPSLGKFGEIIVLFQPHDEKLDRLIDAYAEEISRGRGINPGPSMEARLKISKRMTKSSETPIGQWIENICVTKDISIWEFFRILGFHQNTNGRSHLGLISLNRILQNAPEALGLSEDEKEALSQAVSLEKEQKVAKGHKFQEYDLPHRIRKMQKETKAITFNGSQAAKELGKSREWIRQLRKKFGLGELLTQEDIDMLRKYFATSKRK